MADAKADAKKTLRRFAIECDRLAYECAEGTAPTLIAGAFVRDGQHCALGEALTRFAEDRDPWTSFAIVRDAVWTLLPGHINSPNNPSSILIDANNAAPDHARHAAVVFPLLNLADALRRAATGGA